MLFNSPWPGTGFLSFICIMVSSLSNMFGLMPSTGLFSSVEASCVSSPSCRCFPGDAGWPTTDQWNQFNSTVGGRLIATVPLAAVCHDDSFATFDANKCATLRSNWFLPETHLPSSSSAMSYLFTNNSCNPFLPEGTGCTLGNLVSYAVNASSTKDIQQTLAFAQTNNIRLVIRNTGHDYNGKSTGAGALGLWLHHLDSLQFVSKYTSPSYTGPAMRVGAGASIYNAYKFADANNGIIVGGSCPTVALAGGYIQGGGHGPLASKYGLAVDQVLEWDVVTANKSLLKASPTQNSNLYWALSGGGGGTYGVVVSLTVKVHPQAAAAAASMSFAIPSTATGTNDFWTAVRTFLESLQDMVDSGLMVTWTLVPGAFFVGPASGPGVSQQTIDELFASTIAQLKKTNIPYQYGSQAFPTWLQSYQAFNLPSANVSNSIIGSRLIPRSVLEEQTEGFISALKTIVQNNFLAVGISLNVSKQKSSNVSVNPYWRQTLVHLALGTFLDYQNFAANLQNQNLMTNTLIPKLAALTPSGAAYLSEADFQQPNWKSVLYGANYGTLDQIKAQYDPLDLFYALGAVGSDRWTQTADGRLCRT